MATIQVLTNPNTGGGIVLSGPGTGARVFANGLPVVVAGSTITPHGCCTCDPPYVPDCVATTIGLGGALSRVFVGSIPVSVTGDVDTCGHKRLIGAPTVFVGP